MAVSKAGTISTTPITTTPIATFPSPTIEDMAKDFIARYDANGDGSIKLSNETYRQETYSYEFPDIDGTPVTITNHASYSIDVLAKMADRMGNGDGNVTAKELLRALRSFDTGDQYMPTKATQRASRNDGVLSGSESMDFYQTAGERVYFYYDGVINPTDPPAAP